MRQELPVSMQNRFVALGEKAECRILWCSTEELLHVVSLFLHRIPLCVMRRKFELKTLCPSVGLPVDFFLMDRQMALFQSGR